MDNDGFKRPPASGVVAELPTPNPEYTWPMQLIMKLFGGGAGKKRRSGRVENWDMDNLSPEQYAYLQALKNAAGTNVNE